MHAHMHACMHTHMVNQATGSYWGCLIGTTTASDDVMSVTCVIKGAAQLHKPDPSGDPRVSGAESCDVRTNKWAGASAQDVTHSWEAVLSPLMTINVNRTISAHLVKCLAVDGLLADRWARLICTLIQTPEGWPLPRCPRGHFYKTREKSFKTNRNRFVIDR